MVYYTLGLSQRFDIFHRDAYSNSGAGQCGTPYQRSGLVVSFSQQDLQRIPYNQLIEIPITVTPGQLCNKFVNVELQIIATCEIPNSNSQVFQYGIVDGDISYNDADKIYALNDTATFSVAWPVVVTTSSSSQRRSLSDSDSDDVMAQLIQANMRTMMLNNILMIALITVAIIAMMLRYHSATTNKASNAARQEFAQP